MAIKLIMAEDVKAYNENFSRIFYLKAGELAKCAGYSEDGSKAYVRMTCAKVKGLWDSLAAKCGNTCISTCNSSSHRVLSCVSMGWPAGLMCCHA